MKSANIIDRIEARLEENKTGTKTYANYDHANMTGDKLATEYVNAHHYEAPMEYIVVYLPTSKRFTVVFNMSAWQRRTQAGGYVGHFAQKGFFTI